MSTPGGPLGGITVVVTRARAQASMLADRLELLGAVAVPLAMIEITEPSDGGVALRHAVAHLDRYAQIVVSSPNGARRLIAELHGVGAELLPPVACVGPSTAAQFVDTGFVVNAVPANALAEGLLDVVPGPVNSGDQLLLWQAEVARDVLDRGLRGRGWNVDRVAAYQTIDATVNPRDRLVASAADVVMFTSSSTVERFVRLVGAPSLPPVVASIGPITSATARELGVHVDIEARAHTIDGLIDAVVVWARGSRYRR